MMAGSAGRTGTLLRWHRRQVRWHWTYLTLSRSESRSRVVSWGFAAESRVCLGPSRDAAVVRLLHGEVLGAENLRHLAGCPLAVGCSARAAC